MKKHPIFAAAVSLALLVPATAGAKVVSGTPFADNMVLQRGRAVPVWGVADPGEAVTVSFAGQTKKTKACADGKWRVALDPMDASAKNRVMKIAGADNAEEIKNVLVGEVWFASGQSNMECPIWGSGSRYRDGQGAVMTAMTIRRNIRYAKNLHKWSVTPLADGKGVWRDFSPESFKATFQHNLSAVAFYYALGLYDALGVPVGIIDSSWGGTNIDAWTPRSGYANHPELADVAAYPVVSDWKSEMAKGPINRDKQQPTVLYNGMVAGWAPFAMRGMIWYQGCHNGMEAHRYCDKMHALYDGWSKEFDNPGLKFYFVQLAPWKNSWFGLQMAQVKFAAEEPNAALVTTCDVGNSWDIHPNDKETVARRLLLHALKRDYGFDNIIDDPPALKSWKIDGNKFVMSFSNASKWYVYNADYSEAEGFEIAGKDGKFVPAKIENKGANSTLYGPEKELVVSAPEVAEPCCIRYLAAKPCIGSLYSFDSGLPLGPFEIDARRPEEEFRSGNTQAALGDAVKIPELAGFRKVLEADLPAGAFDKYSFDRTSSAGKFSRVAYAFELERPNGKVEWVVAEMDAFTPEAAKLGVPCVSKASIQAKVANLVVRSNMKSVEEGSFAEGAIVEFFNSNYGPGIGLAGAVGSGNLCDCNDRQAASADGGYGCMQVHNAKSGATIFAYNKFNKGIADIGIGNCTEGRNPDWTFMGNAAKYKTRRLTVLVKPIAGANGENPSVRTSEAKKQILGYQLDVSRCKVPKQEVIYRIVDILASLGYNHFQLYTEHTFAYKGHETVWKDSSPMTPEEIRALDDYCAKRGIDLVPNQNSFGHMERWLKHPEYGDISNRPNGGGGTLNPEDPRSIELVSGLYDQLLPCFRSKYINVGCDETGLKNGRCKAAVEARGETQVYCDFLNKIHAEVVKRGHTMMFWGDIILRHPEFLPQLPKDVVCLNWGYEAGHPFERQTAALEASGMSFIVCPGTSGWGSLFGRAENMLTNVNNAVEAGSRHGAMGYLLADWGDGGHPQPWIISLPSIVYMARRVRGETPSRAEIAADIDRICGAKCGEALFAYGGAYLKVGGRMKYKAELYYVLREGKRYKRAEGVTDESIAAALAQLDLAKSLLNLDGAPDWVKQDFALLDLLARAVKVKLEWPDNNNWKGFREQFEYEYRRLWLLQNRPGGLEESLDWQFCR